MSRKHYIALAKRFHQILEENVNPKKMSEKVLFNTMFHAVATLFAEENSLFDKNRFRIAVYESTSQKEGK